MIRVYQPTDKESLHELVIASNIFQKQQLEKETIDIDQTREVTSKNFEQSLTHIGQSYQYVVAEVDNQLVGFIFVEVSPVYKARGSIVDLFILEDYRNQGIGKQLMEKGLEWLKANGVKKVGVGAHKSNTAALHLYKEFGFEEEEETYVSLQKTL